MDKFIRSHNIENFRRQLSEPLTRAKRATLVTLLAEEEAKDRAASSSKAPR